MFAKLVCILSIFVGGCWNIGIVQDYYWRPYSFGYIPLDALEAAPGKYIGLAWHSKGEIIATIYPHGGTAVGLQDKKVMLKDHVKIFCTLTKNKFYWDRVNFTITKTDLMNDAVRAGYHGKIKSDIYIGRIFDENEWKIGRVIPVDNKHYKGLWVWNVRGGRKRILAFEMLKFSEFYNSSSPLWPYP